MTDLSIERPARRRSLLGPGLARRGFLGALIVLVLGASAVLQPTILTVGNLRNILIQASYLMIFAGAQAVVILTRGFDLSLGVTVSLVSVCAAMMMTAGGQDPGMAVVLGLLAGMAAALLVGLFNGLCISIGKINAFVVTLGTMNIVLAVSSTISGGFPVSPLPPIFGLLATAQPVGIPLQVLVTAAVLLILHILLSCTVFGRSLYLIGSNPRAAQVAGVRVRLHLTGAYVLCSALIAIGALLLTARTGSGEPNLGGNLTLQTIAAAVLGGVSLRGGEGDILAPIFGALFVTVLSNVMDLLNVDGFIQQILLGVIIIVALGVDRFRQGRKFRI